MAAWPWAWSILARLQRRPPCALPTLHLTGKPTKARNLWSHKDVKFAQDAYGAQVPSHGVLLLRVWAQ
jgi:hypothetical protein